MRSATITIPWDDGTQTLDRDLLQTAVLLTLDTSDDLTVKKGTSVAVQLHTAHGISWADAIGYAVAAGICIREGIEP
jgi:hypothetical protein